MRLDVETEFVIYGAGEVGANAAKKLTKNGYNVIGFLDNFRQGDNIVQGYEVHKPNDNKWCDYNEVVVIIALSNGNVHKAVADRLSEIGFKNIVFLPLDLYITKKQKQKLIEQYNNVIGGKLSYVEVTDYESLKKSELNERNWVIKEEDQYVWGYLSQELLFSESYDNWKGDKAKLTGIGETYDKNITLRKWYRSLFEYMDGEKENANEYFEGFQKAKSDEENEELLKERNHLFELYNFELNRGMDFFVDTAPLVEWNEKGYFNLVGGHHRTIFLLSKGFKSFPVKMSIDDFVKWSHKDSLYQVKNIYRNQKIESFCVQIPHPAFSNYWQTRENGKETILNLVLECLRDEDLKDMSCVDVSDMEGYLARIMARTDIGEVSCVESDKCDFVKAVFELLYLERVVIYQNYSELKSDIYDIVFDLNVKKSQKDIIKVNETLFKNWKRYLFIEFSQAENSLIDEIENISGAKEKYKLMSEIYDGTKYNIYVFRK